MYRNTQSHEERYVKLAENLSNSEVFKRAEVKVWYCRNCGQPLVNPDARFCYKCGNVQEAVKHDDE